MRFVGLALFVARHKYSRFAPANNPPLLDCSGLFAESAFASEVSGWAFLVKFGLLGERDPGIFSRAVWCDRPCMIVSFRGQIAFFSHSHSGPMGDTGDSVEKRRRRYAPVGIDPFSEDGLVSCLSRFLPETPHSPKEGSFIRWVCVFVPHLSFARTCERRQCICPALVAIASETSHFPAQIVVFKPVVVAVRACVVRPAPESSILFVV